MGLIQCDGKDQSQNDQEPDKTVFEILHMLRLHRYQVREEQDNGELYQLRRLESKSSDNDPALGVVDGRHCQRNDQKYIGNKKEYPGKMVKDMVRDIGDDDHTDETGNGEHRLSLDVVEPVPFHIEGMRKSGGEHHNKADYRKDGSQQKECPVRFSDSDVFFQITVPCLSVYSRVLRRDRRED